MKTKQTLIKMAARVLVVAFFVALGVASIARATTVGTNITTGTVTMTSTTDPQLTVKYDGSNFYTIGAGASGTTTLVAYGGLNASFLFNDPVRIATSSATAFEVRGDTGAGPNVFVVHSTSGYVGIGLPTPSFALHVATTSARQFVTGYDLSNFLSFATDSTGTTTLVARGDANAALLFSSPLRVATSSAFALQVRDTNQRGIFEVNALAGYVGIGTSTPPSYALHVSTSTTPQVVVANDRINYFSLSVDGNGTTTLNAVGAGTTGLLVVDSFRIATSSAFALQVRDGNQRGILEVDALAGYIGIGTSTAPSYPLHVSTSTTPQFVLANDRINYLSLSVDSSGTTTLNAVGGATASLVSSDPFRISTSSASAFQVVDLGGTGSTTFTVNTVNNRVGIGSSTPSAMFSVGGDQSAGGAVSGIASTTIDFGRACFRSLDSNGTTFYWWFDLNDGSLIATSTTKCSTNL